MNRWPVKSLADVCYRVTDGSHRTPPFVETGFPFATVANVDEDGRIDLNACKRISATDFNELKRNDCHPLPGDVLFSKDGTVGKVAVIDSAIDFVVLSSLAILRPKRELLNQRFLAFALRSEPVLSQAINRKSGTAIRRIVLRDLKHVVIPVPPLAEQERIINLLDEADELRKLRAQADRRIANFIPGLFHEMFGDPEHTRFPVKQLVDLVLPQRPVTYGILKPGPDIEGGVPYVRVLDIKQNRLQIHQLLKTTKEIAYQYRRSMLCPGDILVTIRGTVGRTCMVPGELKGANITQDTARLAVISAVEAIYVVEFLNTPWAQSWMSHHMLGQAVKGINLGDLRKLPVPVPPLPLQGEFKTRVTEIRDMQAEQAASRRRLDDLFQSLLHRAFEGEL